MHSFFQKKIFFFFFLHLQPSNYPRNPLICAVEQRSELFVNRFHFSRWRGEKVVGNRRNQRIFFIARFIKFLYPKTGLNATPLFLCVHGAGYYFPPMTNPVQQMHRLSMPVIFYSSGGKTNLVF